ncbi:MAG: DUF1311 domain-containing protein [Thermomonas sp.]|uniref:lysozyme inhibitor LprI family protein n=1 Tax=Thermomonas sp. TaxID=1971895 RepID=UPI00262E2AF0|nr:lysozyme inhibitor LprI family protein [Thermomonas sp.]MCC7097678.1 DUF1311 domain-containing protein [Thermomonas sp.]
MKGWIVLALLLFSGVALASGLPVQERKITSKNAQVEISVAYPRTGNAAIDAQLGQWARRQADDFRNVDADEIGSGSPWSLDIHYEIPRNDGTLFSVVFGIDSYAGGAHPNHNSVAFNFLLPEGAQIDIEQVIDGRKGLQRLSALTIAKLNRALLPDELSSPEMIQRGAGPEWGNFKTFVLLPGKLKILFDPYAVGPYSSGPQDVEFPLSALKDILRTNLRTPVPSFDCGKAGTPIEHAICANVALAQLDSRMARVYRLVSTTGYPDNDDRVRAAQRAFIGNRNARCGGQQGAALESCLTRMYQARLAELDRWPE